MHSKGKREWISVQSVERQRLIADIRLAEQEWKLADWRFHYALGEDHVDYAIYCLEAAEKKLGMLIKEAKRLWSSSSEQGQQQGGEGVG
ncbi:DUF2508 family protein [Cohnella mopanensis]|uniref:DUF2508 family protein n=1 Tax=Cohnella mopanensis TaxID=2911966 RepID=UPI001EF86463